MNWQAFSFDWNQIRAFLATAEKGSLSAAACALNSTRPTLGRQVNALEAALRVTLFERAGRSFEMTSAGHDLLEHVQAMGDAASRISMVASGQSQDVAGGVTITASELMAAGFLPPVMQRLRQQAPGIDIEIVASDRLEELTRRDADIAIRHVRPDQPDLIARQIKDFSAGFFASTDYIRTHGRPVTTDDLSGHLFLGPRDTKMMLEILAGYGIAIREDQFKLRSDSGVIMWEMMRAGLGIGALPDNLWPHTDGVEPLFLDVPKITFPAWLTTHRELRTSRRIRIVFDALAEALKSPFAHLTPL
jgi:DNA-binding transcriptional LysR family regulator